MFAVVPPDAAFKAFRRFNDPELACHAGARTRLCALSMDWFPGNGLPDRLAREIAETRALPVKELFESFELFERVRRRVRAPVVADLCCGHGLTGMLFAVFEPKVERVVLLDHAQPPSFVPVRDAIAAVAPWAADKIAFSERPLKEAAVVVPASPGRRPR